MSGAEIKQMPPLEKLKLMQNLWHDLSSDPESFETPDWHLTELTETDKKLSEEKEETLDWQVAKAKIRQAFL